MADVPERFSRLAESDECRAVIGDVLGRIEALQEQVERKMDGWVWPAEIVVDEEDRLWWVLYVIRWIALDGEGRLPMLGEDSPAVFQQYYGLFAEVSLTFAAEIDALVVLRDAFVREPIMRRLGAIYADEVLASHPLEGIDRETIADIFARSLVHGSFAPYFPPSLLDAMPRLREIHAAHTAHRDGREDGYQQKGS